MKNGKGEILYVGKAGSLRRRVSSYFLRPYDYRIARLLSEVKRIDTEKTDTAIEALIREAQLIKEHKPPFNVREKDDKSFLCLEITREEFPRLILTRAREPVQGKRFGPFTSAGSIREVLRVLRKIFPWSTHAPEKIRTYNRPCFDYEIGLCPGTCIGAIDKNTYGKIIYQLELYFAAKKKIVVRELENDMEKASAELEFEIAEKLRRRLFALKHIQDVAFLSDSEIVLRNEPRKLRIEGYDISNISGTSAVGSMVVFSGEKPNKNEYRKFKIRMVLGANDTGMLGEVITRRFRNNWPIPDVMIVDGGKGQVRAAKAVLRETNHRIPVVGIAKGPERKRNDVIGTLPQGVSFKTAIRVRDEAHRFAIAYHKKLRRRTFLPS